jgi:hypothetical protein
VTIISKEFDGSEIIFSLQSDKSNLYLNATQTAKKFNKLPKDWLKTADTKNYILSLEKFYNLKEKELIIVKKGNFSTGEKQGTWIHQKLIIAFARWLSPDFAVWCDLQIEEILKSQNSQPVQTSQDFDIKSYTQQNRDLIELIELINSKNAITLHYLDKLTQKLNLESPINLLEIDLNSHYFIPTELGKLFNKSAVEINKILEAKGFQIKENGIWQLTEAGKKYAIVIDNNFSTIKWKLESIL